MPHLICGPCLFAFPLQAVAAHIQNRELAASDTRAAMLEESTIEPLRQQASALRAEVADLQQHLQQQAEQHEQRLDYLQAETVLQAEAAHAGSVQALRKELEAAQVGLCSEASF